MTGICCRPEGTGRNGATRGGVASETVSRLTHRAIGDGLIGGVGVAGPKIIGGARVLGNGFVGGATRQREAGVAEHRISGDISTTVGGKVGLKNGLDCRFCNIRSGTRYL